MKNAQGQRAQGYQPEQPYYPPYAYPPHPMQLPPYPFPFQMGFLQGQPPFPSPYHPASPYHPGVFHPQMLHPLHPQHRPHPQHPQHPAPSGLQKEFAPPHLPPPPPQYPEYVVERREPYKPHPPASHPPNYSQPSFSAGYNPYDHYERHREAQQREERQRALRKREYLEELRGELRRNVREFGGEEAADILEAARCMLKFQEGRSRQPALQRSYERSRQRVEGWLGSESEGTREFTRGLLQALQMDDLAQAKHLSSSRSQQDGEALPK